MNKFCKTILFVILGLVGLCIVLVGISALSYRGLKTQSDMVEALSMADKIRLSELNHLRGTAGDLVWPGWGQADIPMINYNEAFVFLVGATNPTDGWFKVPEGTQFGDPWDTVPNDTFRGQSYYRQSLLDLNRTPEAFTVRVGETWVASLPTLDWMKINLVQQIRQDLPGPIQPVFPYKLFVRQLLGGSDKYISLLAHESFHAYQGIVAPVKLAGAEDTNREYSRQYPWDDGNFQADWQTELDTLAKALQTTDQNETLELARRFLTLRASRRETASLNPELVAYEQQREWLEGLARYAELEIWRQAALDNYTPLPETAELNDFNGYEDYKARWKQEISQIIRMADDEGDGRFYYSGMAQAFLLDRLMPDWKMRAMNENVWLEDLLAEAVSK